MTCDYAAPTKGANTFECKGNAEWGIAKDDDDIVGEVKFGGFFTPSPLDPGKDRDGDGDADSFLPPALDPDTVPTALRASELPGDGWVDSKAIGDLGRAGELMLAGDLPDGCASNDNALAPQAVRTAELVRRGGDQGVGAMDYLQSSADQAVASIRDALSSASLSCLARLLEAGDARTDVTFGTLPDQALTGDATGRRLVLRRGAGTDYLDIIGRTDGRHAQVLMAASNGDPMPPAVTVTALRRIG